MKIYNKHAPYIYNATFKKLENQIIRLLSN